MSQHEKINYLEFPSRDLSASKVFFGAVFGWSFVDYGREYVAFSGAGIDGGFYKADTVMSSEAGSALIVFYSRALGETEEKITSAGGVISKSIFEFPGGRRFHFRDTTGNEYAVWSDVA